MALGAWYLDLRERRHVARSSTDTRFKSSSTVSPPSSIMRSTHASFTRKVEEMKPSKSSVHASFQHDAFKPSWESLRIS
ncbi:hypothetical protein LTR35_007194 [Friedmanniomyces endolithicus]|uniref:Uncharacterized protein n=1 Tax=Friedmanniomyces endolithicus TaxID=329885 RepID=A0AAN6J6R7_9PEZI|nr:hypothetical protein LTR35_007194 [Friedmanniomyces endolithicus]KAK0290082.1 hypothetical protein LTS00_008913 [Friedmanniomyces endolithicus]KAK0318479.1 hypothetical protein LTR82_010541 [Friedmanniomyces endolithicus]